MVEKLLNLFFPLQNINYTNIDLYLSQGEIGECRSKLKKLSKDQSKYVESIFVVSNYKYSIIYDLIHRAKYFGEYYISKSFANAIHQKIFISAEIFIPDPDLIIPIPGDPVRSILRGYNLPTEICYHLSLKTKIPYHNLIYKTKSTTPQNLLSKNERKKNLKNVYSINTDINISNSEIVWLVDDLSTSGETITECAKLLKLHYPFLTVFGVVMSSN